MRKLYLILITAFLTPLFVYSQEHQVNLRLILYPIQILEVHNDLSTEFSRHLREDAIQLDDQRNLNTYSTSNFVLNVQVKKQPNSLSLSSNSNIFENAPYLESTHLDLHSSPLKAEGMSPSEEDFDSLIVFSMEVL